VIGERGGATILVVAWVVIVATVGVGTASVGALISAREQARAGAEAAALAAAVSTYPAAGTDPPAAEAVEYAARNGSWVVSCKCPVDPSPRARTVTVVTAIDVEVPIFGEITVTAAARSEFDPGLWLGL
jgi:hypothetical protein